MSSPNFKFFLLLFFHFFSGRLPGFGFQDEMTGRHKINLDMCEGPFLRKIILYTLPIILTGLLQLLFNAADLIVLGNFCGSHSVGAVGVTGHLISLMVNLFMGLSVGVGVCVAQGLGAKDDEAVHRAVHTAIPAAAVCGLVLTAVGVIFSRTFLEWMETPADIIDLSALYLRIYFAGILPILVYNFGAAILRAAGDTRGPLLFLMIAGVLNVGLNVLFVTLFRMDVGGVALATTLSQCVACALVLVRLARRKDACRLMLRKLRFYRTALLRIVRIGLPAGLQGCIFAISNVIIQSSINGLAMLHGTALLDGSVASGNIEGFIYVTMNAFQQTAVNFVGQNTGAGRRENISRILVICLSCVSVAGLAVGWLAIAFSHPLLSLYVGQNPDAVMYGTQRIWVIASVYFLCGIMDVMSGALRGMGSSFSPMLICVIGVCGVRLVWIYTVFRLETFHTLQWLVFSWPLSWVFTFAALLVAFLFFRRRSRRRAPPPETVRANENES